jgi:hypothetical protein
MVEALGRSTIVGLLDHGDGVEPMKNFSDLSQRELLALPITLEEEDSRIYSEFAHG